MDWRSLVALVVLASWFLSTRAIPWPPLVGQGFQELIKAAVNSCDILPVDLIFSRHETTEASHLDMLEFTSDSKRSYRALATHRRLRDHYSQPGDLLIYVPGFWNTPTDESSRALVKAFLRRHKIVLMLDTRPSFCRGYIASASRVRPVADLLFGVVKSLHEDGFPPESIHMVGFSLGAHVAGVAGRLVQKGLGRRIGRITGLDPARPCFARSSRFRLSKKDARFVHVVHTSAGGLGLEHPVGHVDLYVNGVETKQPECEGSSINLRCEHALAWRLFSASVNDARFLMGSRCNGWNELKTGSCNGNETALGYGCSPETRGVFLHRSDKRRRRDDLYVKDFSPLVEFFTWWMK